MGVTLDADSPTDAERIKGTVRGVVIAITGYEHRKNRVIS